MHCNVIVEGYCSETSFKVVTSVGQSYPRSAKEVSIITSVAVEPLTTGLVCCAFKHLCSVSVNPILYLKIPRPITYIENMEPYYGDLMEPITRNHT